MPDERTGQLLAFTTACLWVLSASCFQVAGRRIGSVPVNLLRLILAVAVLTLIAHVVHGRFWPVDATPHVYLWITVSGVIGFFLCDLCLFRAYVLQGARRSMLMLSLAPVAAAVLDVVLLRAVPPLHVLIGMLLTITGVLWVILDRAPADQAGHSRADLRRGALLALSAAVLQALGAVSGKLAMDLGAGRTFSPLSATQLRATAGMLGFAILVLLTRRTTHVLRSTTDARAMGALSLGALLGPVLGVTAYMGSLARIDPSVTQTILALMPILAIGPAVVVHREKITPRILLGTAVSVTGLIVLCWKR